MAIETRYSARCDRCSCGFCNTRWFLAFFPKFSTLVTALRSAEWYQYPKLHRPDAKGSCVSSALVDMNGDPASERMLLQLTQVRLNFDQVHHGLICPECHDVIKSVVEGSG